MSSTKVTGAFDSSLRGALRSDAGIRGRCSRCEPQLRGEEGRKQRTRIGRVSRQGACEPSDRMKRQTYPGYEPPLNLRSNNDDAELLTRQDCHIGRCIRMAWRLNACVCAPEPGPVDYAGYRINDHLQGPCKHITGVQDVQAIDGGSTCLSYPWVQFRQKRPRAEKRIFATHVPHVIYAGVELNHMSELPDIVFENLSMYLYDAPVNETPPAKTLIDQRPHRMYWGHDSGVLLNSGVVILFHVREVLVAVGRNGFADEHVRRTLGRRRVGVME